MSTVRYRPKRRLRSEIFPLAVILALPVALYFAFPSGVIDFAPKSFAKNDATCFAIVQLDSNREARLLASARSAWQSESSSRRGNRANLLSLGEDANARIASGLQPSVREDSMPAAEYSDSHIPSGLAAEPPATLAPEKVVAPEPPFPKSELLKLN